jgi:hypothetical protein
MRVAVGCLRLIVHSVRSALLFSQEAILLRKRELVPWESQSKRTCSDARDPAFKKALVAFYNRRDPQEPGNLFCQVLNRSYPSEDVIGAHIWKHATGGHHLDAFGLRAENVDSPRNGLLLARGIEQAFDKQQVCFLYDMFKKEIFLHVIDQSLNDQLVHPSTTRRFRDVDNAVLQCPPDCLPYRRLLAWHAIWALHRHNQLDVCNPETFPTKQARYMNLSFDPKPAEFPGVLVRAAKIPRHLVDPLSTASDDEAGA